MDNDGKGNGETGRQRHRVPVTTNDFYGREASGQAGARGRFHGPRGRLHPVHPRRVLVEAYSDGSYEAHTSSDHFVPGLEAIQSVLVAAPMIISCQVEGEDWDQA
jgi:hypothetical protein